MRLVAAASLLAAAVVTAVTGCTATADMTSSSSSQTSQAIINGASCDEATDPTAIAILFDGTLDFSQFGAGTQDITTVMCTGTLIAPDTVLTAAHCTDPSLLTGGFGTVTRADYYVSRQADLGALIPSGDQNAPPAPLPESAIPVKSMIANEDFNINDLNSVNGPGEFHDVALMFLTTTIDDVEPELLITKDEAAAKMVQGASVEIAGWGQQTQTSGPFDPPPACTVGIKECGTSTINELGTAEMQIGGDDSTVRKCHGDSGGPTYLDVGGSHEKTRRVIGITSHAYDQQDCAKGGVDTRADVHLDWIDGKMKAGCDDNSRVWCDVKGVIPPDFFDPAAAEGEGEGDGGNDGGPHGVKKGCASTEAGAPLALMGLALIAVRRRRRC